MNGEYLAIDSELRHGVHNAQEGGDRLSLFTNFGLVQLEIEVVVIEVLLNLLAVDIEHIEVSDGQNSSPTLVAVGQLSILNVEDTIEKGEVV